MFLKFVIKFSLLLFICLFLQVQVTKLMFITYICFWPPTGFQFLMLLRFFKLISLDISCILLFFVILLLLPYSLSPAYTISWRLLSNHSSTFFYFTTSSTFYLSTFLSPVLTTPKLGFKGRPLLSFLRGQWETVFKSCNMFIHLPCPPQLLQVITQSLYSIFIWAFEACFCEKLITLLLYLEAHLFNKIVGFPKHELSFFFLILLPPVLGPVPDTT